LALPIEDLDAIRPAFRALLERYGMAEEVGQAADGADLRRRFVEVGVRACLDFQREGSEPTKQKTVDKYAEILGQPISPGGMRPRHLVAPYFAVGQLDEASLADQAALNAAALAAKADDETMWCVLAVESVKALAPLTPAARELLAVPSFQGAGVWVSDLDEHEASVEVLRRYRSLVSSIGRPVWVMYGGYFALLLGVEGVMNVSHGIYYTESKKMRGPVGSGPAPERYYVPALHRFYPPAVAFRLIQVLPAFQCSCEACAPGLDDLIRESKAASGSPSQRMAWIRRLQRHFLHCRDTEVRAVAERPRSSLVKELRAANALVAELGRSRLTALPISSDHLERWATALDA
jgi:hypothetical protein